MFNQKFSLLFLAFFVFSFVACDDDEKMTPNSGFTVTIENTLPASGYLASGTFDAIPPGGNQSFSFNAGKGAYLSFATMFVQSNDLFYAPDEIGLGLFQDDAPRTGNVTSFIDLWDSGTEVNQEPGVGADQAPRQSGPNTGADENGTVELIENINDGYTYPADEEIIKVELAHDGGTQFTVTITNVSDGSSLPTPLAPGVFVVHNDGTPLFTEGSSSSAGLEGLAEDGNNGILGDEFRDGTQYTSPFAPGVFAIHKSGIAPLFNDGSADRGEGLEGLAEDGDPGPLATSLSNNSDVSASGVFNTPTGASSPGPLLPGGTYTFTFDAEEGDYLSFATMLVHTNDLFYGFDEGGIALFD